MLDLPPEPTIVVTVSRLSETKAATPASVTVIDEARIERLGEPLVTDLLRLSPSLAVSVSGPAGSLTDVRIRGAEASHSLLFVDGIRANDPAAGNAPRFELLNADLASRIEIVRGPQSALWGSEAIGGVIALDGASPGAAPTLAFVEAGSFATRRAAARTSFGDSERGFSLGIAGQRSAGIDSFSGDGDRDGYRNRSARASGIYRLSDMLKVGVAGFAVGSSSEFDGYDPVSFARADTADRTRNRLAAARVHAIYGDSTANYAKVSASLLGSSNRNLLAGDELNRTRASRRTVELEAGIVSGRHHFLAAAEGEGERFHARDQAFGGFTDQDRDRRHHSLTVEWKMSDLGPLSTDLAVRHDIFSRFKDATTLRASALVGLGHGLSLAGIFGEGIAQPSFFDLFGFFPGNFAGNPSLKPETSRGGEIALRYRHGALGGALTYYRQRLRNEIVDVFGFPSSTTVNADGTSRRHGLEAELDYRPSNTLHVSATYAFLDASEPRGPASRQLREQRRPRHSGSIAIDGTSGRFGYGTAIAYTGARLDTDFDVFPAQRVRLDDYWLASARLAYRLVESTQVHVRIANAFNARYQDVLGYRTAGRSIHAGLSVAFGR